MKPAALLAYELDHWCVTCVRDGVVDLREAPIGEGEGLGALAAKAALHEMGFDGRGVVLSLPSQMVFWAEIDCGDLPRKQRRAAMRFRLEELLPMDVETLTADFLPAVGGRTMGVAAQTDRVRALIDALADEGLEVEAIGATSLLALWELARGELTCDYVLLGRRGHADVFRIRQGQPASWYTVADDRRELEQCLRADALSGPSDAPPATACLLARRDSAIAELDRLGDVTIERREEMIPVEAAARAIERLPAGEEAGWVDFLRDELESVSPWGRLAGLVRSALVLAVALLVVLAGALYWRSCRYAAAAENYAAEQATVYKNLYPNTRVPTSVVTRLESEWRRLAGTSGASAEVPARLSALETLRQLVESIPPPLRVRLLEIRILPGDVLLQGQTRSHSDAQALATSLETAGFPVDPPRTEVVGSGEVSFTLRARPPAAVREAPR